MGDSKVCVKERMYKIKPENRRDSIENIGLTDSLQRMAKEPKQFVQSTNELKCAEINTPSEWEHLQFRRVSLCFDITLSYTVVRVLITKPLPTHLTGLKKH